MEPADKIVLNTENIELLQATFIDSSSDRTADLGLNDPRKTNIADLITTNELRSGWLADQLPQPKFHDEKISQANKALRQNRFVILRSSCQSLAEEITLKLQTSLNKSAKAQSVTFYGDVSFQETIDLFSITDGLEKLPNSLMFVELNTLSDRHLRKVIDQLKLQASINRIRGISQRLKNQAQWIIFYLSNDCISSTGGQAVLSTVSLGFTEELCVLSDLWSEIADRPTPNEIVSQFQGPASHLWGTSNNDRLRDLESEIRSETLAQKYQIIQGESDSWEKSEKDSYRKVLDEILFGPSSHSTDLLPMTTATATQKISRYMLAVITQIDDLSPIDFRELLLELVGGEVAEITTGPSQETKTIKYAEDGITKIAEVYSNVEPSKVTVKLSEALSQYQDQIIARFRVRQRNGKLVFKTEAHALVARECVSESLSIFKSDLIYRAIANSPLLFQVSDAVAMQLCRIYAGFLKNLTHDEKANKLCDFYFQFLFYSEASNTFASNCDFTRAIQNANRMAAGQDAAAVKLKADFYYRFGCLLESICVIERSGETVHSFIGQVLKRNASKNTELTYDVVLHIVRNLRHVSSVDTMHWLKIVLTSGRQSHWEQSCHEISIRIAQETTASRQSDDSTLAQLASWLPNTVIPVGSYNNHSAALFIPRLVCLRALQRTKKGTFGEISDIPPFFDLANEDGHFNNVQVALDLLCRPVVSYQMEELDFKMTWNLLHTRWGLRNDEGKFDIGILEPNFDSYSIHTDKLRLFVFLVVLIEAVNVFVVNPEPSEERRWVIVKEMVVMISKKLINEDLCTTANLADQFDRNLCMHNRLLHYRRIEISRYLGGVFFEAYSGYLSTTEI